jgi:hypothetical protein
MGLLYTDGGAVKIFRNRFEPTGWGQKWNFPQDQQIRYKSLIL